MKKWTYNKTHGILNKVIINLEDRIAWLSMYEQRDGEWGYWDWYEVYAVNVGDREEIWDRTILISQDKYPQNDKFKQIPESEVNELESWIRIR